MNNLQIAAQMMLDTFETKTRDNGESFVYMNESKTDWMSDIAYKAHMDTLSNDIAYTALYNILDAIVSDETNDPLELASNAVPCSGLNNIADSPYSYYLDEVLDEYNPGSFWSLLAAAYERLYSEVAGIVISELTELIEDAGFDAGDDDMKAEDIDY